MRWSISTKIFIGIAIIILAFGSVGVLSLVRTAQLRRNILLVREGIVPLTGKLSDLTRDLKAYHSELSGSDLIRLRSYLPRFKPFEGLKGVQEGIEQLARRPGLDEEQRKLLVDLIGRIRSLRLSSDIRASLDSSLRPALTTALAISPEARSNEELYAALARTLIADLHAGRNDRARALQDELASIVLRIRNETQQLSREFRGFMGQVAEAARRVEAQSTLSISMATGGALLVAIVVMFWVAYTIRPIQRLQEGAQRVGRGDFTIVDVTTNDEIGDLASEFNAMAVSLADRDRLLARQREELLRSERLATIGKMSSQITHEIRNPLSSMGLNSELLEEELVELQSDCSEERLSECRALLTAIRAEIDRLTAVTEQYLRFARLPKPDLGPVSVNDLITDLLDFMREELLRHGLQRELVLDPYVPTILLDQGQIRQAVLNLIRNSIEAMGEGGHLTVQTQLDRDRVVLRVADDGPGMSPETVERIFDPFFSTKATGTGLGLALVHQIITEHQGTITCHSEPGQGTEFAISLPLAPS